MRNYSFADLIHPTSVEDFFESYWERTFLHVARNDDSYYEDILTSDDIDAFLENKAIPTCTLRMVRDGNEIGARLWARSSNPALVDNEKVFGLFANKATIVVNGGDRSIPPLIRYCSAIERELKFRLQFNLYITPPGAKGFAAHYDDHDVFILHVSGVKTWRIYHVPVELPSVMQRHRKGDHKVGDPQFETQLSPGDLLYVPRGFMHDAVTSETASIHITFGMHTFKWFELVDEIARVAQSRPEFRRSLPHGFATDADRGRLKSEFATLLRSLIEEISTDELLERKQDQFILAQASETEHRFRDLTLVNRLNLDSVLARRENIRFKVQSARDQVAVKFYNKTIPFPWFVEGSLELFQQPEAFAVRDIGGLIDDKGRLELASKFVTEGLVEIRELNAS